MEDEESEELKEDTTDNSAIQRELNRTNSSMLRRQNNIYKEHQPSGLTKRGTTYNRRRETTSVPPQQSNIPVSSLELKSEVITSNNRSNLTRAVTPD